MNNIKKIAIFLTLFLSLSTYSNYLPFNCKSDSKEDFINSISITGQLSAFGTLGEINGQILVNIPYEDVYFRSGIIGKSNINEVKSSVTPVPSFVINGEINQPVSNFSQYFRVTHINDFGQDSIFEIIYDFNIYRCTLDNNIRILFE